MFYVLFCGGTTASEVSCSGCRTALLYIFCFPCTALSSGVKQPALLTAGLRQHLSRLLEQYYALQEKANSCSSITSGREDGQQKHQVFQQLSSLEPVVTLVQHLEKKEMVNYLKVPHSQIVTQNSNLSRGSSWQSTACTPATSHYSDECNSALHVKKKYDQFPAHFKFRPCNIRQS